MALVRPSCSSAKRLVIQFSHGNGFPASSYRRLLEALDLRFEVHAIERIGHDPRFPVSDGWPHLVQELIAAIELHQEPVLLLGHSLGGILSIAAARARPRQVRAVVILDAPVISGWRGLLFSALKLSGLDERYSPAAATLRRRTEFESLEAALRHFRSKPLFRDVDDETLTDYLGHPEMPEAALRLAFDATIEAQIYRTIPHRLKRAMPGAKAVPMGFLAGCRSAETRMVGLSAVRKLVGSELKWMHGSHLFPLERPLAAAKAVDAMFQRLRAFD